MKSNYFFIGAFVLFIMAGSAVEGVFAKESVGEQVGEKCQLDREPDPEKEKDLIEKIKKLKLREQFSSAVTPSKQASPCTVIIDTGKVEAGGKSCDPITTKPSKACPAILKFQDEGKDVLKCGKEVNKDCRGSGKQGSGKQGGGGAGGGAPPSPPKPPEQKPKGGGKPPGLPKPPPPSPSSPEKKEEKKEVKKPAGTRKPLTEEERKRLQDAFKRSQDRKKKGEGPGLVSGTGPRSSSTGSLKQQIASFRKTKPGELSNSSFAQGQAETSLSKYNPYDDLGPYQPHVAQRSPLGLGTQSQGNRDRYLGGSSNFNARQSSGWSFSNLGRNISNTASRVGNYFKSATQWFFN